MKSYGMIDSADQEFSTKKLKSYYDKNLIPAEKKPYLTELEKSRGPYLAVQTEAKENKYLQDAASQIATLGLGFNPSVFFGAAHHLESWTDNSHTEHFKKFRKSYTSFFQRQLGWDEVYTHFCHGGAEANEIALGMAYESRKHRKANKVLAFKGSFHGRLLVALSATWNPVKREPFEWEESEAIYCELPELYLDDYQQPFPENWRQTWENSTANEFKPDFKGDDLLTNEVKCLLEIREQIRTGKIFAVIIEPMQCEGGDRLHSDRFNNALALMCKVHNIALVYDEVQTGFHMGREFFWHKLFNLTDSNGKPLNPDFVTAAKKAQTGLVLSTRNYRWKEEFHVASAFRGYIHAVAMDQAKEKIIGLEEFVRPRLEKLIAKYPDAISRPRIQGMAFAMELKDKEWVSAMVAKRFERGLLFYPAGSLTLRFRLNIGYTEGDVEFLFQQLDALCSEVIKGEKSGPLTSVESSTRPVEQDYAAHNLLTSTRLDFLNGVKRDQQKDLDCLKNIFLEGGFSLKVIDKALYSKIKADVQKLQAEVYEPARQTAESVFSAAVHSKNSACLALFDEKKLIAIAFSAPLQNFPNEKGVRSLESFHNINHIYMVDTTVIEGYRGKRLGKLMKYAVDLTAQHLGVEKIFGRNRDRLASSMLNINLSVGAIEEKYLSEDYLDSEQFRDTFFYHSKCSWAAESTPLSHAINHHFSESSLTADFMRQNMDVMVNKMCLSNFASEKFLRLFDDILAQLPKQLQHGYSTSAQSEGVDKIVKSLWLKRKPHKTMVSFEGMFFGQGSFLSRSLNKPEGYFFETKKLPFPTNENQDELIEELRKIVKVGVLGVFLEPLTQRGYRRVPMSFLLKLRELCNEENTPLVFNETASQMYRYGEAGYFVSNMTDVMPDMGMAYLGGQAGIVFSNNQYFLEKPLMLISTWDGDELSFARYHHAMTKIEKNRSDYIQTRKDFNAKLLELLAQDQLDYAAIENGCGHFAGNIRMSLKKLFIQCPFSKGHHVNPNYDQMKWFLKEF